MPEMTYTDDELGLNPGWDDTLDPNIRQEIRRARKVERENRDLAAKVATYERERLLARAGVPQDKRGDVFARTYDGPTDDPAAVKAAFEELFGPAATETSTPGTPTGGESDPTAGDRRVADATAAGTSEGTPGTVDLAEAIRGAKDAAEVKEIIRRASQSATFAPGQMIPRLPDDI